MSAQKTVDGSGLNELDQHGSIATDMWTSAAGDPAPWIQYEFDMAYKLDKMLVWNSNQLIETFVGIGARDVVIEYSLDGIEWTVLEGATLLNQAPGLFNLLGAFLRDLFCLLGSFLYRLCGLLSCVVNRFAGLFCGALLLAGRKRKR